MVNPHHITAAGWIVISLGHTRMAGDWHPALSNLPSLARTCAKAGWYEGSGFFLVAALLNYAWAQDSALLDNPVLKAVAGLLVAIPWAAGSYYAKRGVTSVAGPLAVIGALQAYSGLLN